MRMFSRLILSSAALAAGIALAADPSPPATPHAEARQRLSDRIDTNHDGAISRAEYRAWVDARFAAFDLDGDGRIDAAEIERAPATAKRVQRRADRFVRRYDHSGSGAVSLADFEAARMAAFDRISGGTDAVPADRLPPGRGHGRREGSAPGD
jgi:EF hand domain-containing protein